MFGFKTSDPSILLLLLITTVHPSPVKKQMHLKNSTHLLNNVLKDISSDILIPPDHLKGIPMERDGHLNKEFRKEVIIGTSSNDITINEESMLLTQVFNKADLNNDKYLNQDELNQWIALKVKDHFQEAVRENFLIFTALDQNHNGRVSWDEYHSHFLLEEGYDSSFIKNHTEDHKNLQRRVKEKILLDKAAWSEAANSDPDSLNIDEFLTFRHPEHSHVTLLNMVNDILNTLDINQDMVLSEEEFSQKISDDSDTEENRVKHQDWKKDRLREFRESIDLNKDGKVNRQELLMYNDPENPALSRKAARDLISLADSNRDGLLSLNEILAKKDLFLGSKMVDTAKSFHDEF